MDYLSILALLIKHVSAWIDLLFLDTLFASSVARIINQEAHAQARKVMQLDSEQTDTYMNTNRAL